MRISIEWFLLDNTLMNFCVLSLAAALSGLRLRPPLAAALCALGGVYALVCLAVLPALNTPIPKLLFACVISLGLQTTSMRAYGRGVFCVLASAALLGGLMLLVSLLFGKAGQSGMQNGALIGSIETRAALVGVVLAALLPRMLRALRNAARTEALHVPLRFELDGVRMELDALIDTGNLLNEPVTGLPVVLVCTSAANSGKQEGYPVRFCGVNGEGVVLARRAERAKICIDGIWRDTDIMVARSPIPIVGAKAIVGNSALPPESVFRRNNKGEVHRA